MPTTASVHLYRAVVIHFPPLRKCHSCGGTGLTWSLQRRTGRPQVAAKCPKCAGSGKTRKP